jgi:hypothetical protein
MGQVGCLMARRACAAMLIALCVCAVPGCGDSEGGATHSTTLLTTEEVKQTLRQLPYRYEFHPVAPPAGAYSAVAGTAFGRYGTEVKFGVAFGRSTLPIPVPHAGIDSTFSYEQTFIFTDDLQFMNERGKFVTNPQLQTGAQWKEAIEMSVEMTGRLCRSATGAPCPV